MLPENVAEARAVAIGWYEDHYLTTQDECDTLEDYLLVWSPSHKGTVRYDLETYLATRGISAADIFTVIACIEKETLYEATLACVEELENRNKE